MPLGLKPRDAVEFLDTPERIAAYIEAAIEDSDAGVIAAAIGDIARARGMTQIAQETGRSRESLYRALSERGNPELSTLVGVLKVFRLQLRVRVAATYE